MPRPKKAPAKTDLGVVVRRWESSPILYGFDSRFDRKENPDYHPAVSLTSRGKFVADSGAELSLDEVPEYILKAAKGTSLDTTYYPPQTRTLSMRDAMIAAGVDDTDPDPDSRKGRPRVSREVYA